MFDAEADVSVALLQQGGTAVGSTLYGLGILSLLVGAVAVLLIAFDVRLSRVVVLAFVFAIVLSRFQWLHMFVLGLTVAVVPAVGILVIYLLMEVPVGS